MAMTHKTSTKSNPIDDMEENQQDPTSLIISDSTILRWKSSHFEEEGKQERQILKARVRLQYQKCRSVLQPMTNVAVCIP